MVNWERLGRKWSRFHRGNIPPSDWNNRKKKLNPVVTAVIPIGIRTAHFPTSLESYRYSTLNKCISSFLLLLVLVVVVLLLLIWFRPVFGPQHPRCQRSETTECVQLRVSASRTAPKPRGPGCMSPAPHSKHVRVGRPYQCHSFQLHSCSTQALSPGKLRLMKVQIPSKEMYTSQSAACI